MSSKVINFHQLSLDLIFWNSQKSSGVEAVGDKTVITFSVRQKWRGVRSVSRRFLDGWLRRKFLNRKLQFDICVYFKTFLPFDNGIWALYIACSFFMFVLFLCLSSCALQLTVCGIVTVPLFHDDSLLEVLVISVYHIWNVAIKVTQHRRKWSLT